MLSLRTVNPGRMQEVLTVTCLLSSVLHLRLVPHCALNFCSQGPYSEAWLPQLPEWGSESRSSATHSHHSLCLETWWTLSAMSSNDAFL